MPHDSIIVRGAREHNLKNIDVVIPRDRLVVITGVSGSGKSSLAFDTIYAEGQRRYVDRFRPMRASSWGDGEAGRRLYRGSVAGRFDRPEGRPTTCSTVARDRDLRLSTPAVCPGGHPHCPNCGPPIERQTVQIARCWRFRLPPVDDPGARDQGAQGEYQGVRGRPQGWLRPCAGRRQGARPDEDINLSATRCTISRWLWTGSWRRKRRRGARRGRMPLGLGGTALRLDRIGRSLLADGEKAGRGGAHLLEHFACANCGLSIGELEPRNLSFNSPHAPAGSAPALV
jgi:excinuclease ABC subunit A